MDGPIDKTDEIAEGAGDVTPMEDVPDIITRVPDIYRPGLCCPGDPSVPYVVPPAQLMLERVSNVKLVHPLLGTKEQASEHDP